MNKNKYAVYQVFTRLFGNTNTTNQPWGTIEQNGVGKFSDFTHKALSEIKALGMTHIWYTGVPHHAVINDYSQFGIENDHPSVVKGRAGSPYAVKDYYSVNPDLADDPNQRLQEFEALVARSHENGLKVIIDIVPNHVARKYQGMNNPEGITDFGAEDDTSVEYHQDNNFYYIPEQAFELPDIPVQFAPLGGEYEHSDSEPYAEFPAKWTGNGSRLAKPDFDDWYETVKVNYGIRPDGSKDFPELPQGFDKQDHHAHFEFWQQQKVPSSWVKFRDIALYWLAKGVDGFRYDMAEMVPVEFWSYMNSFIKMTNPDAFLMAEVYQPDLYRDYIHLGKMDYLYDKVDLYDSLKAIIQQRESTQKIAQIQKEMLDIEHHMLHFLDNHDEQRIASPEFAGNPDLARPAMLVSALLSSAPTMIYFGQEVGEPGSEMAGFGQPSRTSIFDYIGVPHHQRWMNQGKFDGALSSDNEKELRYFYQQLMNFSLNHSALTGDFDDLYDINRQAMGEMQHRGYVFARSNSEQVIIGAVNFDAKQSIDFYGQVPASLVNKWQLVDGVYTFKQHIGSDPDLSLIVENGVGHFNLLLKPLAGLAFVLNR
ncbi:alpha-amylase family protein [Vibrio sp. Of7-15]|uniref:alpha-amylase family protein n=1 Tax=Vibrio sp. Of7-15 TaxID=2724879 RepID=UPI001EF1A658|nr:alpha-amylase family protein [Vibrio sp. Of7-15]MCG7496422.1 alpha-amylase family protein [Vibrio sp. Of7-15]